MILVSNRDSHLMRHTYHALIGAFEYRNHVFSSVTPYLPPFTVINNYETWHIGGRYFSYTTETTHCHCQLKVYHRNYRSAIEHTHTQL